MGPNCLCSFIFSQFAKEGYRAEVIWKAPSMSASAIALVLILWLCSADLDFSVSWL